MLKKLITNEIITFKCLGVLVEKKEDTCTSLPVLEIQRALCCSSVLLTACNYDSIIVDHLFFVMFFILVF